VAVVAPFAAGGSTDFVARLLAQALSNAFGQQFVVDNRTGTIGTATVARARPDGYTLLVSPNSTFAMAPYLYKLNYDSDKAFAPISLLATNAQAVCVQSSSPIRTLADLIAAAKAEPGKISYGSGGIGVSNHLVVELFAQQAGIQLLHVPYRGGAPAAQAVLSGEVGLSFIDTVTALPFVQDGSMRALAVTSAERSAQLPEVPTIAESGQPGYRASTDFALFAPTGTPEPILRRLGEATMAAMRSAEVREKLAPLAIEPVGGTPEEFPAYFEAESRKWRDIIQNRNIQVQ
jgi:tripartite-type tricarboxylate transporter receptor subunit TctC